MIFVDNISQLWFYRKKADEPCYCEHLVYPNDLMLQATLNTGYTSGFSYKIEVYSANGLTNYGNYSQYFSFYIGVNTNGVKFFNIRCEEFAPPMCTYLCYILKVTVSDANGAIFEKFTEQYCQTSCCDIPRGISIAPEGTENAAVEPETEPIPYGSCNTPLIRIRCVFECIDNETGLYYGIPTSVLQGTATFAYEKITNFSGIIRRKEREINRLISYNCNLQRSESFKPYEVKGNSIAAFLPDWKLDELENMLHASFIEIDDFGVRVGKKEYQYAGGTIGERVYDCWDVFRINFTLQECTVRTNFGCGDCETVSAQAYLIPLGATGENFYTENKQLIGDYDALVKYYEDLGFIVTDVSGDYDNVYGAFTVQGSGSQPNFFYDNTYQRNKVYGTFTPVSPVIACAPPQLGTIVVFDDVCTAPQLGTIVVIDQAEETADIYSAANWVVSDDSEVILVEGYGRLFIDTSNSEVFSYTTGITADTATADITVPDGDCMVIVYGSQSYQRDVDFTQSGNIVTMTNGVVFAIGDDVTVTMNVPYTDNPYLTNEIIGVIANNGWPSFAREITTTDYTLVIDTEGRIYYTGYATTPGQIVINNLYYTL